MVNHDDWKNGHEWRWVSKDLKGGQQVGCPAMKAVCIKCLVETEQTRYSLRQLVKDIPRCEKA